MATRDKTGKPRKAAAGKPTAGAKAAGKSAPKKASRKSAKATGKTAPGKASSATGAKKVAVRRAPARPPIEILARNIVRAARDFANADLAAIYDRDATSTEPTLGPGSVARGLLEIRKKKHAWQDRMKKEAWTPRRVFAKGNTICIVWQADLVLRDNRKVKLDEVAIHEVKGGKVIAERFYYDPAPIEPKKKKKRKAARKPPESDPETEVEEEADEELAGVDEPRVIVPVLDDDEPESPIDPIDL